LDRDAPTATTSTGAGVGDGAGTAGFGQARWWRSVWPWLVGVAVAVVVLGPALAPGSVFAYDLALPPDLPVPRGVWGLGPELPRRVPLLAVPAWLAPLVPSWLTGKAIMVAALAAAFVGVFRLLRDRSTIAAVSAGLVYAVSPFVLTRLAAGHLPIVVAVALLPWCFRRLLRPGDDLAATALCCGALACTGSYGGLVALVFVAAGLVVTRGRRAAWVVGTFVATQLVWLAPALFVLGQGGELTDGHAFATVASGPLGWVAVAAGDGFWNRDLQIGWPTPVMALFGAVLLGLAIAGHRDLPRQWRRPVAAIAVLGAAITLISAFDVSVNPFFELTRNAIGANVRDSQRAFTLVLLWLAPASALGAARLAHRLDVRASGGSATARTGEPPAWRPLVEAIPALVAVALAGPGLFGLSGHLDPATIPSDWEQVRQQISDAPGTVVSLPWHEYATYDLGTPQMIFDPWPFYLGGDVIICSDPERETKCNSPDSVGERADRREPVVGGLVRDAQAGTPIADGLAGLGVRWVVVDHVADWQSLTGLANDPGLEPVVRGPTVDLYRVKGWSGVVVDDDGHPVPADPVLEPWWRVDASGPAVWNHPASGGWRRGTDTVEETPDGLLRLPAGSGPLWYWPAVIVMLADVVWLSTMVVAGVVSTRRRRRRRAARPPRPASPAAPR
jgi:hypothetical protein